MKNYFFKDVITFLTSTSVIGSGGETVKTFTTSFDLYGSFQDVGGSWNIANDLEVFKKNKRIFCEYSTKVNDQLRVKFADQIYNIIHVSPTFNNHHLTVNVERRSTE
jgi:SPP1 family predicted phage head-tail adaptor